MARDGGGGPGREEPVRRCEEEHERAHEGRQAAGGRGGGAQGPEQADGPRGAAKVRFLITARRVRIDPESKRREYLSRLEGLIRGLDGIIADPDGVEGIQVRAMDVMIRAFNMCYRIVRDVDVETLEDELARLEEENQRAQPGGRPLGYEIEEAAP